MASGVRLRADGQRKLAPARSKLGEGVIANSLGVSTGGNAEHRLNLSQVHALEHMFQGNPAVTAARTVLSGQLLSGGISLRKNGKDVELQPAFKDHLNEVWLPFAQEVIDSFLKWGLVVVSYEEHEDDLRRASLLSKRRKVEPPRNGKAVSRAALAVEQTPTEPPVIVPMVPTLGSYEIAFRMGGRIGYKREYTVYACNPSTGTRVDEEARVVVRQHPDHVGNVNSPLASVFELGSFVAAITELATIAESSRARPRMVTQMRKKDASALDPGNLFFDSESRAVQAGADQDESSAQARALQLQQQMCDMINKLQTKHYGGHDHDPHSFGGAGSSRTTGRMAYAPPEVSPSLFHLPKDHEVAPHLSNPESRGDLEALTRLSIEQFSAAFGVPADLIFSGRFAGKSTSQLSLLNTTVSQLAKAVNSVLTIAYRDIYAEGPSDDVGQLQLLTSPLAATDEVLNLYAGGLVPVEIAMPSVLHAIGATKDDIDFAVQKAKQNEEEVKQEKDNQKSFADKESAITIETKQIELDQKKQAAATSAAAPSSDSSGGSSAE